MQEVSGDHLWPTVQTGFMKGERKRYLSIVLCESRKREIGSQIKLAARGDRFDMADLVSLSSISLFSISLLVELRSKSQIRIFINQNQETKSHQKVQTKKQIRSNLFQDFFHQIPFHLLQMATPSFPRKVEILTTHLPRPFCFLLLFLLESMSSYRIKVSILEF